MKQSLKFLALLVAAFLLLSLMTLPAFADSDSTQTGINLEPELDNDDTPTIDYNDLFQDEVDETRDDHSSKSALPTAAVVLIVVGGVALVGGAAGAIVVFAKARKK